MFSWFRKKSGARETRIAEGLDFDRVPEFLLEHEKWTPFVTRMAVHCGDLPSPDGTGTLVTGTVAAGCRAMAALDRSREWQYLVERGPDESLQHYKARVRLGLFYAGCLAYLLPVLCGVEVQVQGAAWVPVEESFTCFWRKWGVRTGGKAKGKMPQMKVAWGNGRVGTSEILVLASFFFTCREVRYVWPAVARGVVDHILPGEFGVLDLLMAEESREPAGLAAVPQLMEGGDVNGPGAREEGTFRRD